MSSESPENKQSQLIGVLREGVSVVQMIFFKEMRSVLSQNHSDKEPSYVSMLAGAIINDVFGTPNQEERFVNFYTENRGLIEQELLSLKDSCAQIFPALTDALRIQSLCDTQEGGDSSHVLTKANELGILVVDREIPLPSTFMTLVRILGEQHNLIISPVQITPEQDQELVH